MAKRSYWPAPVYCATFADGTTGRMSFWSEEGKPFDFARGRRLLAWAYGKPVLAGAVEYDGRLYPDELRSTHDVVRVRRPPAATTLRRIASLLDGAAKRKASAAELRAVIREARDLAQGFNVE